MICIKHPKYVGDGDPDLRCKACCRIFTDKIKSLNEQRAKMVAEGISNVVPKTSKVSR